MAERALPRLDYIGDVVVGVVSDCWCQKVIPECAPGDVVVYCEHPHESHDIVPPRTEDELPDGVDFGDYKRWCRMFAAAPALLAALREIVTSAEWTRFDTAMRVRVMDAIAQVEGS